MLVDLFCSCCWTGKGLELSLIMWPSITWVITTLSVIFVSGMVHVFMANSSISLAERFRANNDSLFNTLLFGDVLLVLISEELEVEREVSCDDSNDEDDKEVHEDEGDAGCFDDE